MRYIYTNLMILTGIVCFVQSVFSETRVTYKSAKSTSSYYQMGVQIAEAMKQASSGKIIVTVEESQGSVQNVMEAAVRPAARHRAARPQAQSDLRWLRGCRRTRRS